jgi:hypothetical protein
VLTNHSLFTFPWCSIPANLRDVPRDASFAAAFLSTNNARHRNVLQPQQEQSGTVHSKQGQNSALKRTIDVDTSVTRIKDILVNCVSKLGFVPQSQQEHTSENNTYSWTSQTDLTILVRAPWSGRRQRRHTSSVLDPGISDCAARSHDSSVLGSHPQQSFAELPSTDSVEHNPQLLFSLDVQLSPKIKAHENAVNGLDAVQVTFEASQVQNMGLLQLFLALLKKQILSSAEPAQTLSDP